MILYLTLWLLTYKSALPRAVERREKVHGIDIPTYVMPNSF